MEKEKCPMCKGRHIMEVMYILTDAIPELGSFYDDDVADIINSLDDAIGSWQCMCNDQDA